MSDYKSLVFELCVECLELSHKYPLRHCITKTGFLSEKYGPAYCDVLFQFITRHVVRDFDKASQIGPGLECEKVLLATCEALAKGRHYELLRTP